MVINNYEIYHKAYDILRKLYGNEASFREGQYEAIESVFLHKRTLIVEKTGWGKSLIYFISTKLLRNQGSAPTLVVSPLLSLMDNQMEAANKIGLNCAILNHKSDINEIISNWKNNLYDLIFITPETLFNEKIQSNIDYLQVGFFVVDEVHCISDYGHDFRLKYMRLKEIIDLLPLNVPILGVTATANDYVLNDLKNQLGDNIFIQRGSLTRESLNIQVINLDNMVCKYAWILANINIMPGSGIIYCLTQKDCDDLCDFLLQNDINCMSYHNGNTDEENDIALNKLKNNEIKVLIATIKLGMGYDKDDIGFIIHLQLAENVCSYYQQIGRAGRKIDNAYIFLLFNYNDTKIIDYFNYTAFPKQNEQEKIYDIISSNSGVKRSDIISKCNFKTSRIDKSLEFLENDGFIFYDLPCYYSTNKTFYYDESHYNKIRELRKKEVQQMIEFTNTKECYNKFLANALDDFNAERCGKCSNCIKHNILNLVDYNLFLQIAFKYIYNKIHFFISRKQDENRKKLNYINELGICLSYYGDYGYGSMVEYDKYNSSKYRDEIVNRCIDVIKRELIDKYNIRYITCVPSNHNNKMEILCEDISKKLDIKFIKLLEKNDCPNQKQMENSYFQSLNAKNNYYIVDDINDIDKIILIDDIVDSKWTLTWCGYFLMENGIFKVYPFALSDSSNRSVGK